MFGSGVKRPFWPLIHLSLENSSSKMVHRELSDERCPPPGLPTERGRHRSIAPRVKSVMSDQEEASWSYKLIV